MCYKLANIIITNKLQSTDDSVTVFAENKEIVEAHPQSIFESTMPTTSINLYHMQDAKNNFEALRPAPVCLENNMLVDHCQSVHVSTNCYYGYHDQKALRKPTTDVDCEMMEAPHEVTNNSSPRSNARKRSAEESLYPKNKRLREEIQIEKSLEPETIEKKKLETSSEDSLENYYWNLHGGNFFHVLECL